MWISVSRSRGAWFTGPSLRCYWRSYKYVWIFEKLLVGIGKTNHFHHTGLVTDFHKKYHRVFRAGQFSLKGDLWRRSITEIHFVWHNCNEVVYPIWKGVPEVIVNESCGPKVRFVCALNRVPGVVEMADWNEGQPTLERVEGISPGFEPSELLYESASY